MCKGLDAKEPPAGSAFTRMGAVGFVGRTKELRALRKCIASSSRGSCLVYCEGAGGVGKTTLVGQALIETEGQGHRGYWLRGGTFPPTETNLVRALAEQGASFAQIGHREVGDVLVVDALELMSELEGHVFDEVLPQLGPRTCVIVTSRQPLSSRIVARFQSVLTHLGLGPFSEDESRIHLERGGMPAELHSSVVQLAKGHPLALSLALASFRQKRRFVTPERVSSDVLAVLIEQLVSEVSEGSQRNALYLLAILRELDVGLLQTALGCHLQQAESLLGWLAGLPFVEGTGRRLRLHDRLRAGLHEWLSDADPHQRDLLARKAGEALLDRAEGASLDTQRELLVDVFHAHRHLAMVRGAMCIESVRATTLELGTGDALESVRHMVDEFIGESTSKSISSWANSPRHEVHVVRDASKRVVAAAVLSRLDPEDSSGDPVEGACLRSATSSFSLRGGEEVLCFRVLVSRGGALPSGPDMAALMLSIPLILARAAGTARLCYFAVVDPRSWMPLTAVFPVDPLPGAEVELDGRQVGLFVSSAVSQIAGLPRRSVHHALLCAVVERMLDGMCGAPPRPAPRSVDRESFPALLHEALKNLERPRCLEECRLCRDAAFGKPDDPEVGAQRLREIIQDGCDELGDETDASRVLRATYLSRSVKQEAAAAELGWPFGTYRYRLRRAEEELATLLWSRHARRR